MPRISHVLIEDHRRLKEQFRAVHSASTAEEKVRWRDKLSSEIARHCVCEELLLRDPVKEHVAKGEKLWAILARDHTVMKEKIHKLKVIPPDDDNFQPVVESLQLDLFGHMSDVNVLVLRELEDALRPSESEMLATEFCEKRNEGSAELTESDTQSTAALVREFLDLPAHTLEELDPVLSSKG